MNCADARALAGTYVLDAISESDREEMDRHLDDCAACRAYVAALSEAAGSLAALVPPQMPPAGLKERIFQAALRTAGELPGSHARPSATSAGSDVPGGQRWRRARGAAVRAAAAVAFVALGWVGGRIAPAQPASTSRATMDELTRMRLERDLWHALSAPGAAVMPLTTDTSMAGAVAYAAVLGDQDGCWVRLVAEGLPAPPNGMRYAVWVSTRQGEIRPTGQLTRVASGRWELSARIDTPPAQLGTLWVILEGADTVGPDVRRPVAWGQLWPGEYGW